MVLRSECNCLLFQVHVLEKKFNVKVCIHLPFSHENISKLDTIFNIPKVCLNPVANPMKSCLIFR